MDNEKLLYDKLYSKSIDGGTFKHLLDFIIDDRNIMTALNKVYKSDSQIRDIEYYRNKLELLDIYPEKVKHKEYIGMDGLSKSTTLNSNKDMVLQYAIKQILYPVIEAKLHHNNYGNREIRNFKHAIANLAQRLNLGKLHWVSRIDISEIEVNPNILIRILRSNFNIIDERLLILIKNVALSLNDYSILKPFFINIYLNEFDWWFSNQWDTIKGHDAIDRKDYFLRRLKRTDLKRGYFVRYGTSILVLADNKDAITRWNYSVKEFFKIRLKLDINSLTKNLRKQRVEFMGYSIWMSKKSKKYVMFSDISPRAEDWIYTQVVKFIKVTSMKGTGEAAKVYNWNIKRIHNYYAIATNSNRVFNSIWNRVRDSYYNRFSHLSSKKELYSVIKSNKKSSYYDEISRYKSYHIQCHSIDGIPLIPICCVIHEKPMNISYSKRPFTYLN